MKNFLTSFVFLLMGLIACSAGGSKRSVGQVLDDAVITNEIKIKYMKDKEVKAFQIDIDTWKGVVSLHGGVESQAQINRAIELAEMQPGVKEVKSYLIIEEHGGGAPAKKSSPSKKGKGIEEYDIKEEKIEK